jgi:tetratricopeptide (TPR) repeat protein
MTISSLLRNRRVLLALGGAVVLLVAVVLFFALRPSTKLPAPGDALYTQYADLFQLGTAALDSDLGVRAEKELSDAITLISKEPAALANRGLLYLRQSQLDKAEEDLKRAETLAKNNPEIQEMLSHLAQRKGDLDAAIVAIEIASDATPNDVRRLYRHAQLIRERGGPDADKQRAVLLDKVLALRPTSLPLLVERLQLAVRQGDAATIKVCFEGLSKSAISWKKENQEDLAALRKEAEGKPDIAEFNAKLLPFTNQLKAEVGFTRSALELTPPANQVGTSLQNFLVLAPLQNDPAPRDRELTFAPVQLPNPGKGAVEVFPVWLNKKSEAILFTADALKVRSQADEKLTFDFPSGKDNTPPSMAAVVPFDWNNDGLTDFLFAGAGGLRFHQQRPDGSFIEATSKSTLPPEIRQGAYFGAWAVDVDLDGDLDLVVATLTGQPLFVRNNGDGSFAAFEFFIGVTKMRDFVWIDLDYDGAPDAVMLDDAGKMHIFLNERSGVFRGYPLPEPHDLKYAAIAQGDVNDDGRIDLVALQADGQFVRMGQQDLGRVLEVVSMTLPAEKITEQPGQLRLLTCDLDNNGSLDLVLRRRSGGVAWLSQGAEFEVLPKALPGGVSEIVSLPNGQQGLFGIGKNGDVIAHQTQGTKDYRWQRIRPIGDPAGAGDQRINSMAKGSEIEIRSGSLLCKQMVTAPVVQFGLGSKTKINILRIVWPNGSLQFEFDKESNAVVEAEQRLKGSCPFLYGYDGQKFVFVKDFLWSSPLGMYINAQGKGVTPSTIEWIQIPERLMVPREGVYELRVNANLWETHFVDHLSLMVVDHPEETTLQVEERFFLNPVPPHYYLLETPTPIAKAVDHNQHDVTSIVSTLDATYLDRAGRGSYQGITNEHYVEFDLGEVPTKPGPLYLLATGWTHPTDSSINFAIEQGQQTKPQPLSLEIPDGKGGWRTYIGGLGFPAGKNKTMIIRLDVENKVPSTKFRLRTNMEIYWDALRIAKGLDLAQTRRQTLVMKSAELRHRGILKMTRANASSPELAHYDQIEMDKQYWRDLIGYHTRHGDVKELLEKIEDRYVIMNAGDEIALSFTMPEPPKKGWKRSFVWVSDGWVKDGDYNTRWGKTVLPLPYHAMQDYNTPPGALEEDPVYRRFPNDWKTYHTRWITPDIFERGLRR